ncbi:hypothetical protein [Granulicella arctica]|uniref:Uncharacterized protein n=1 Tax=Granulicella arctica TaxID=940613 RepID=A0A7Y9PLG2_9BACT|nr:hypothetical protein [Granulicella arctica]NYF81213.1 hypothetical protein [Granulicella arctica]
MIFRNKTTAALLLAFFATGTLPAVAGAPIFSKKKDKNKDAISSQKLSANQNALIDKAILREKDVIKALKERTPLVETYIQNMKPDKTVIQVPESDQHFLGRVDFDKVIDDDTYKSGGSQKKGVFKQSSSFLGGLSTVLRLNFHQAGFVQMILVDSNGFDRQHYAFGFVRNEFLGGVPTSVFDVTPISGKRSVGRFFGRIWVERNDGNIVRFNGDFAGSEQTVTEYYHFDSWRTNVQPNLWLPTSFYVEESDSRSSTKTLKFKAINHIWGYVLKVPNTEAENTSLDVVGATDVSNDAQDVSPLGAQREWVKQAEDNVIERLFQAGLLDAPSDFDKTLSDLANNILIYNGIQLSRPIRVRTLLTEPLESLAIGNTIILSKSLIDTTAIVTQDGAQQMGNLNAVLAFQLAHVILGHRLDTKYAFSDSLLFPSTSVFKKIPMHHTDADNEAAAKRAVELLSAKELAGGQPYFGLYLQQLQQRAKALHSLTEPTIGDGLIKNDKDHTFWMQAMVAKGGKLDQADLKQQAAVPLSSFLRYDPWTDQVIALHSAFEPLLMPADKMPFEVEPVYLKLSYYKAPVQPTIAPAPATDGTAGATAAPPPADATTGTAAPPAADPVTNQPTAQPQPPQ